ncbi:MAG: VRR-NUC domain-containing protein, partial [Pseudomonadales bacterium]|nr:VRR-NUC domain-containing protein [Pseudomonadales bacterium]
GPERLLLELVLAATARDGPTQGRRNRALARLARLHEHAARPAAALRCLLRADGPPAREQACRRLAALGDPDAAEVLRQHMAAHPGDATEAHFAARFAVDRGRCRPASRGGGIAVERLEFPATLRAAARVEALAAAHVAAAGARAFHLEGRLAGLVFMLACWDLVFAPLPGAFVQPFQAGPLDLFSPAFAERRREPLDRRLGELATGRFGTTRALAHWDAHQGTVNALLPWQAFDRDTAATLFDRLPPAHRAALCAHVAADPVRGRRGFPDLTVLAADGCRFLEVKGPGDTLRPDQRDWLAFLRSAGIPAGVLEVRFAA